MRCRFHSNIILLVLCILWISLTFIQCGTSKTEKLLLSNPDFDIAVISCDKPWETRLDYASIIEVDGHYVMYYRAVHHQSAPWMAICYAISDDGLIWEKPDLGIYSFAGNTHNNIITDRLNGVGVLYKDGIYYWLIDRIYDENNNQDRTLRLLSSDDGIIFDEIGGFNVPFFCDSQNQVIWDEYSNTYRWYFRSWFRSDKNIDFNHSNLSRSVSYYESDSLNITIQPSYNCLKISGKDEPPSLDSELRRIIYNQTEEDYDIYNPSVHQYRKNLFIAYPTSYYHFPSIKKGGVKNNDGKGCISFWVSKDGENFKEKKHDYIANGDNWIEFCIGHIETDKYFIHYYIPFSNSHAGKQNCNQIRARIHLK